MIRNTIAITPQLVAEHGLKPDEYQHLLKLIGREPTLTELASSRDVERALLLQIIPPASARPADESRMVIQGRARMAGVIDIGDGLACVFKMESHNHPSFIEPYQGATTGVAAFCAIVFTMGARPIACLNALRFGDPAHPAPATLSRASWPASVAMAIPSGVPTVAGRWGSTPAYNGNILVNAMALGPRQGRRDFLRQGHRLGKSIVYLGSKTGRDGIHGATMAVRRI